MSSNPKPKTGDGDLTALLGRAIEDLWSQAGRIGTDIKTAQEVTMAALAGGIVDDRKYVVGAIVLICL